MYELKVVLIVPLLFANWRPWLTPVVEKMLDILYGLVNYMYSSTSS